MVLGSATWAVPQCDIIDNGWVHKACEWNLQSDTVIGWSVVIWNGSLIQALDGSVERLPTCLRRSSWQQKFLFGDSSGVSIGGCCPCCCWLPSGYSHGRDVSILLRCGGLAGGFGLPVSCLVWGPAGDDPVCARPAALCCVGT
jgi:hypothetical protein